MKAFFLTVVLSFPAYAVRFEDVADCTVDQIVLNQNQESGDQVISSTQVHVPLTGEVGKKSGDTELLTFSGNHVGMVHLNLDGLVAPVLKVETRIASPDDVSCTEPHGRKVCFIRSYQGIRATDVEPTAAAANRTLIGGIAGQFKLADWNHSPGRDKVREAVGRNLVKDQEFFGVSVKCSLQKKPESLGSQLGSAVRYYLPTRTGFAR